MQAHDLVTTSPQSYQTGLRTSAHDKQGLSAAVGLAQSASARPIVRANTSAGPPIGSMTASDRPRREGRSGSYGSTIDLLDLIDHSIGENPIPTLA